MAAAGSSSGARHLADFSSPLSQAVPRRGGHGAVPQGEIPTMRATPARSTQSICSALFPSLAKPSHQAARRLTGSRPSGRGGHGRGTRPIRAWGAMSRSGGSRRGRRRRGASPSGQATSVRSGNAKLTSARFIAWFPSSAPRRARALRGVASPEALRVPGPRALRGDPPSLCTRRACRAILLR